MRVKKYCPICGEELIKVGYNYETGHIEFHCEDCDRTFIDEAALDEEEALELTDEQ